MDYKPNYLARSLVLKRTQTTGVVIPDIRNPYFPAFARGVEDEAQGAGWNVVLCNTDPQQLEARYEEVSAAGRGIDEIEVGQTFLVTKTVGESDVYLFAGITGDLHPNHVDEEYMKGTRYGRRIAHGSLMVGFMSAASTKLLESVSTPCVSYGYDRVRFIRPVFIGDTITVEYKIVEKIPEKGRTVANITAVNQQGEVVAAATHILQSV